MTGGFNQVMMGINTEMLNKRERVWNIKNNEITTTK